jgi:hypothetical protein
LRVSAWQEPPSGRPAEPSAGAIAGAISERKYDTSAPGRWVLTECCDAGDARVRKVWYWSSAVTKYPRGGWYAYLRAEPSGPVLGSPWLHNVSPSRGLSYSWRSSSATPQASALLRCSEDQTKREDCPSLSPNQLRSQQEAKRLLAKFNRQSSGVERNSSSNITTIRSHRIIIAKIKAIRPLRV